MTSDTEATAHMPDDVCPIEALMTFLDDGQRPSLAWVVRWSQGGVDPVLGAWRAAKDAIWMRRLLGIEAGLESGGEVQSAMASYPDCCAPELRCDRPPYWYSVDDWWCPQMVDEFDWCPACCDAIRRAAPVPPTLADLVAVLGKKVA